jgi:hypothetical protein
MLPMNSHELFAAMPPDVAADILDFNHNNEKKLYRAALEAIARARKVRAVFLERQPKGERYALLTATLSRPALNQSADTLLRNWLLKKHSALLIDFLDALDIKHEKGVVEDLPKSIDEAKLRAAVEALLEKHPRGAVTVYLHAFNAMNGEHWENLERILQSDSRLRFNGTLSS